MAANASKGLMFSSTFSSTKTLQVDLPDLYLPAYISHSGDTLAFQRVIY